ncbi:MAG: hypothetical protein H6857_03570 [Rhodospirillales bacterium]|nr:hypothetical protein [Rhodospirillales bacterium]
MGRFFQKLWQSLKQLTRWKPLQQNFPLALPAPPERSEPMARQEEKHACPAYMELKVRFRDIGRLSAIGETLGRDFLTAMPNGAYQSRLGQLAFLFRRMHEDLTHDKIPRLLDEAKAHEYVHPDAWDIWDSANLHEMENLYRRHCHIGGGLMEEKARLEYVGRRRHQEVLRSGNWNDAREFLEEQIELNRKIAAAQQEVTGQSSALETLMQNYMPGVSLQHTEALFTAYLKGLNKLLPKIEAQQATRPAPHPLSGQYDAQAQMWLNTSLLKVLGFDFERGGLYETGHNPVEGGTPDDTRLVIKSANVRNFMPMLKSALHEGGHGLYIQGLPRQTWRYQPVGQDLGAAMQESQALLVDMLIGRSKAFFEFLSPRAEGLFHDLGNPELSAENLYRLRSNITRTPVRRNADEVTYFFHIMLRFRLEKDLFDGTLKVADLPEAWNAGLHELLGIKPDTDQDGILQDVHWFVGKFGYFPSYALGHMIAAQLTEKMTDDLGPLEPLILRGDLLPIKEWLNIKIHSKGRLMSSEALLKDVTGKPLSHEALLRHIEKRHLL